MSNNQFPSDVQFAGLIQAATAAADAQERNVTVLGKRRREQDDSLIDTQLREQSDQVLHVGQLPPSTPILQNSATVLFREPSEASKKYSRPPLGKVYTDLQLAPENFLRLQNAAKAFMLDDDHLQRRDVVGHKKHSNNNDVAKLRLWSCVEEFLDVDENGERWFGHGAGIDSLDTPPRTFFWPEDRQKVTKLCMPLFRKMVTNERQRLYASETRKQDTPKTEKSKKRSANTNTGSNGTLAQMSGDDEPNMGQSSIIAAGSHELYLTANDQQQQPDVSGQLTLHVNIVYTENGTARRVVPRFTLSSDIVPTLPALAHEAHKRCSLVQGNIRFAEEDWFLPVVKVWLPDGLVRIKNDGQWMVALLSSSMVEWMDSEIKILIEVESNPDALTG